MQKLVEDKDSEEPSEAVSYERVDAGSKHELSNQALQPGQETTAGQDASHPPANAVESTAEQPLHTEQAPEKDGRRQDRAQAEGSAGVQRVDAGPETVDTGPGAGTLPGEDE